MEQNGFAKGADWKILVWKAAVKEAETAIGWYFMSKKERYQLVVDTYWKKVSEKRGNNDTKF